MKLDGPRGGVPRLRDSLCARGVNGRPRRPKGFASRHRYGRHVCGPTGEAGRRGIESRLGRSLARRLLGSGRARAVEPDDGRRHRRDRRPHDPDRRPLARRLRLVQLPRLRPRTARSSKRSPPTSIGGARIPSWSRLLGSPVLYEQIEERLAGLLGAEDVLVLPTITLIHLSVIPLLAAGGSGVRRPPRAQDDLRGRRARVARGARSCKRFEHDDTDELERLLRADSAPSRLICIDGVNSMTGNVPDLAALRRTCARIRRDPLRRRRARVRRDRRAQRGRAVALRHAGEQHRPLLRRELREHRARRRALEGVLVACRVHRLPARDEAAAEDCRAALSLLRPLAGRLARDDDLRARCERTAGRRAARGSLGEDAARPRVSRRPRRVHAQPGRLPDHRSAARTTRSRSARSASSCSSTAST